MLISNDYSPEPPKIQLFNTFVTSLTKQSILAYIQYKAPQFPL